MNIKIIYIIFFIFIGIISGSRIVTLGGYDTGVYEIMYHATNKNFSDVINSDHYLLKNTEKGFIILMAFFKNLNFNFNFFLLALGISCGLGIYISLKNITNYTILFLTIFLSKGYLYYFFTAQRQVIALVLCWYSIIFIIRRKFIPFFILVIIASTFHTSALFFLIIYFFPNLKINKKKTIILFFISVILAFLNVGSKLGLIFSSYLPSEKGEKLVGYIENTNNGVNVLNYVELIPMFFIFINLRNKFINKYQNFNLFYNIFLLYFFLTVIFYDFQFIARLKSYFVIGYILLFTIFLNNIKNKKVGIGVIIFFILIFFLIYIRILLTFDNGNGYLPYDSFLINYL
ncbi:EpsG family protein [Empedobacter falsenii]